MIDAVVFDIDGTLVDSVELHARCWSRAFEKYGKHIPVDVMRWQIGKGGDKIVPAFLTPEENARFGDELDDYRSKLWLRSYIQRVVPLPAAKELVERVVREGKKVAMASSAKGEELEKYLKIVGIEKLVDTATSSDDADQSKPNPDIFQAALQKAGVSADRAVVLGDTPYDAIAATRAGIASIGVLTGGWAADDLRAAGCIAVYHDVQDLLLRYDESPLRRMHLYRDATPLAEIVP